LLSCLASNYLHTGDCIWAKFIVPLTDYDGCLKVSCLPFQLMKRQFGIGSRAIGAAVGSAYQAVAGVSFDTARHFRDKVQNIAARTVLQADYCSDSSPLLQSLHLLPAYRFRDRSTLVRSAQDFAACKSTSAFDTTRTCPLYSILFTTIVDGSCFQDRICMTFVFVRSSS
jgi:hypothetical protein